LTPSKAQGTKKVHSVAAGWSSLVARKAHNLEVPGSNPGPATTRKGSYRPLSCFDRLGDSPTAISPIDLQAKMNIPK
jgi:hypothetical protein